MTGYLVKDSFRALPDQKDYPKDLSKDLDLVDKNYYDMDSKKRVSIVKKIEEAAKVQSDKIISVTSYYNDSNSKSVLVNSNGFEGSKESTNFWAGADVTVKDEGDKRPSDWIWVGGTHLSKIPAYDELGKEAAERALMLLGSKKIKTQTLPLIIENRNVPRLLRNIISAMNGSNLQQKRSFLEGKLNKKIASKKLTITDNPFLKRGLGSRLYDKEGIGAKKMEMIDQGVLKTFYIDTYYGRKLKTNYTTQSPSNLIFPKGKKSPKELMKSLNKGIFVTGFLGGNFNSTTGDFSVGINGQYFENGEIVKPVSEMNVAGNHLEFWNHLVELGNDPYPYRATKTPCFVFDSVMFSGA